MQDPNCDATPQLSQPQCGYRFSADAVALADFAQASATDTALDFCSGCGVVPILMWQRSPFRYGVGVELDAELATLARRNVAQLNLEDKIQIVQADLRFVDSDDLQDISPVSRFDIITANPPYWPADRGRLNPNLQRAAARHEVFLTLDEVLAAARRFLKPGGRLYLSHLESRKSEILANLERTGLVIRRIQSVSGLPGRLLFEAHLNENSSGGKEVREGEAPAEPCSRTLLNPVFGRSLALPQQASSIFKGCASETVHRTYLCSVPFTRGTRAPVACIVTRCNSPYTEFTVMNSSSIGEFTNSMRRP